MENIPEPKLIILRGPTGAGKSTVAQALREQSSRKNVIIEQDYYQQKLTGIQGDSLSDSRQMRHVMLVTDCLIALEYGFDVILEGILNFDSYEGAFEQLFSRHKQENYLFYFDISLDETKRRHALHPESNEFGAEKLNEWYEFAQNTGYEWEYMIPETLTLEEIIHFIQHKTKL